jgi:hypothetical protein
LEFFVPAAEDEKQAEEDYSGIKAFARQTLGWKTTERRIFSLTYQHEGERYFVDVRKPDPRIGEIVVAILESNSYLVYTYSRGVLRGEPILEQLANRVVPCKDAEHGHLLEGTQDQGSRGGRAGDPEEGRCQDLLHLPYHPQTMA